MRTITRENLFLPAEQVVEMIRPSKGPEDSPTRELLDAQVGFTAGFIARWLMDSNESAREVGQALNELFEQREVKSEGDHGADGEAGDPNGGGLADGGGVPGDGGTPID